MPPNLAPQHFSGEESHAWQGRRILPLPSSSANAGAAVHDLHTLRASCLYRVGFAEPVSNGPLPHVLLRLGNAFIIGRPEEGRLLLASRGPGEWVGSNNWSNNTCTPTMTLYVFIVELPALRQRRKSAWPCGRLPAEDRHLLLKPRTIARVKRWSCKQNGMYAGEKKPQCSGGQSL